MPIYTVSQISDAIKKTLEGSFSTLQIRGEISNLRLQSSGHYYFTLKDDASALSCALFRGDAQRLKKNLKDGDQIVAMGNLSVFAPKGSYQLIVKDIEHHGLGDLLTKLEALKQAYKEKGYFEVSLKKALPKFPKTIGVITSPTGAVIQDIIQTLSRRHKGFKLLLIPTKVQGEGAAEEISSALKAMNQFNLCDVIICGRGGGSLEDLWCFNEACVVEAIHQSKIPVISAVGHETDFTLADFVADVRAPTPTAAAEMALFDSGEFLLHIKSRFDAIKKLFFRRLQADQTVLNQLKKRPEFINPAMILQGFYFSFDKLISRLENHGISHIGHLKRILEQKKTLLQSLKPEKQLSVKKSQMDQFKQSFLHLRQNFIKDKQYSLKNLKLGLKQAMQLHIKDTQAKLKQTAQLLESIHPDNVLKKGYAILTSIDGQTPYTSVYDIQENQDAYLKLKDGSVVIKIKEKSLI